MMQVKNTILTVIIVFLLASYCYIAFLALHPNVPSWYRAYYIDRTTTLLPREYENMPPYRAGTPVGHNGSSILLFDGWSQAEEKHRWSLGKHSNLVFFVEDPAIFSGKVRLNCFYFATQHIAVDLNGTIIAMFTGSGEDISREFVFDPKLLKSNSLNTLHFEFPDAESPGIRDRRKLALALREITIY